MTEVNDTGEIAAEHETASAPRVAAPSGLLGRISARFRRPCLFRHAWTITSVQGGGLDALVAEKCDTCGMCREEIVSG